MLQTRYNQDKHQAEPGGGEKLVETQGYIPADIQIEQMLSAGIRLDEYRKEKYDFGPDEEVPDDFIDPTRNKGFDLADGSLLAKGVVNRLEDSALKEERKKEEEKKKIEEEKKNKEKGGE